MTHDELYEMIHLPEGVREQLKEYEKHRKGELPTELVDKLFRRDTWGEAIKELQIFLCEDPYSSVKNTSV